MGNIFVISDLHFGHKNMALHRGFETVEDHDHHIIKSWNRVVGKRDTVWILGDISMEKRSEYHKLNKLNGHKKVIMGNHDLCKTSHNLEMQNYVNSVGGAVTNKVGGYLLSHVPVHPSELKWFKVNIHGHVHENSINDTRYINVSCEAVNYTPQILKDLVFERSSTCDFGEKNRICNSIGWDSFEVMMMNQNHLDGLHKDVINALFESHGINKPFEV